MSEPMIFDKKDGIISVKFHMGKVKLYFDTDKWIPFHGVADSGSTINISFRPIIKKEKIER